METHEQKGRGIVKTIENDPQYFGGYLNMARLNIYNINNHIARQFNQSILHEENEIKNSFLCDRKIKQLNWNHVFARVKKFMPILKVFDYESLPKADKEKNPDRINIGKDFALMSDQLKCLFSEIQEFRDDYSHYYSISNGCNRKTTVSEELAVFLKTNFSRAIEYTKERFKDTLNEADFQLVSDKQIVKQNNKLSIEGFVFLISMFLEREHAFQFIGKIPGLKGTQYKSFIATREVLMAFCIKLPHSRLVSEDRKQAFSLDLVNTLNRCPKILYNVITDQEKKQFRPTLDDEKIRNLIENSTNDSSRIEDYDTYVEALVKQVRHNNRFADFALKFIDEMDIFSEFRFQVNLGKLLIEEYTKLVNNEELPRTIVENAKAFGKISEFEDEATIFSKIDKGNNSLGFEQFAPYYNKDNNRIGLYKGYKLPTLIYSPKSDSKIKKKLKQVLPEAFLSIHELQKVILLEYLREGKSEEIINDFILANNNKITNRQFIEEVKKQLPDDWNEFQKRSDAKKTTTYNDKALVDLQNRKEALDEILAKYNLNHKQIPSRILEYWLNIVDVSEERAISDKIKLIKRDGMERLKLYQKFKKEGRGKVPKTGEMATFLAKDIVGMIISEDKKKQITSFYYDLMQECLALYANPEKKSLFIEIITRELKLFDTGGHPFLQRIKFEELNYTQDIYEKYLQEKVNKLVKRKNYKTGKTNEVDESWMMKTFYNKEWDKKASKQMTIVKLPDDLSNIPFSLRRLKERNSYTLDQWLSHITKGKNLKDGKKPVNLPTNLFDDTISGALQNELDTKGVSYPDNAKYNELFKIWWHSRGDSIQEFYSAEREYTIFDEKVNFEFRENAKFADFYKDHVKNVFEIKQEVRKAEKRINRRLPDIQYSQVEKVFKRTISNTEKEIRFTQEEDQLTLLMLEKLLANDNDLKLKLCNIDTLLNETLTIKQAVSGELSFNDLGELIMNNTNPEISKMILDERKRKDHSMLQRFIHDRRLPELFEYFIENEIPLSRLKDELNAYNEAKHLVLDAVFSLEKGIISNSDNINAVMNLVDDDFSGQHLQHKPYLLWLQEKGKIYKEEFIFLNMVRNCFSHNQFPQKRTMELFINEWKENNFALQIADIYNKKIDRIIREL